MFKTGLKSAIAAAAILGLVACTGQETPEGAGGFQDELILKLDDNGREATLIGKFTYVDSYDLEWTTPEGWIVDGASIPRPLWAFIGGPFSGLYRKASVIHDYYCDVQTRPWQDVHRVFYDAMLASGVGPKKAATMYLAVYRFGPRWDMNMSYPGTRDMILPVSVGSYTPEYDEDGFAAIEAEVAAAFGEAEDIEQAEIFAKTTALDEAVETEMLNLIGARIEAMSAPSAVRSLGAVSEATEPVESDEIYEGGDRPPALPALAGEPFIIEDLNAPLN